MKASPQLLILATAIRLFEDQLESGSDRPPGDLLLLGRQLHRLNRIYIGLVETILEEAGRDRVRE